MKIPVLVAVGLMVGTAAIHAQSIQLVGITNSVWRYSFDNSDQYALGFPNVDDSIWPEGRAVFGNDPGYPYPNVVLVPGSSMGVQTSYYRTRFNWAGGPPGVLIMTNYIDDGLFVFLNGTLIFNWNVNGEPAHATQAAASNPGGEPVRVVHQVLLTTLTNGNANPLIGGQNVLAVSVHQAGTGSADSVFAMSVYSSPATPPCPIGVSPTSTNAIQCHNVTLKLISLVECGLPVPTIQWFHDDRPIAGATAATLTLMNVQPGVDDGQYYARLSNPVGTADSAHAAVYVAPDTQGPRIVSVSTGFTADNRWLVTFDEPVVSWGGADDTATYDLRSFGTPPRVFSVLSAVIQSDPTEVLLITDNSRFFGENYGYSTSQAISDVCGGVSTPPGLTGPVWVQSTIIDDSKDWHYNDAPQDQGTAWVAPSFDDSAWKTGRQMFDRHRADLDRAVVAGQSVRTFLELTNYAVSPPTNLTTVYLRLKQTIPAGIEGLVAYPIYDDGFIMYINGTEVYRANVVAGADQFANYGGAGGINAGDANYVAPFAIPLSAVMLGAENTIAVMLKQNDATSSDLTFGLRLVAKIGDPLPEPCSIVRQPEPTSVSEGHALTLRVLANCTGPTYQWFKDGLAIAGATSAIYSKLATTADAGNYWVAVSNLRGTVLSTPVAVTVRPVIVPYGLLVEAIRTGPASRKRTCMPPPALTL